jgi:NTP pyrophosphatase (non-canonical NTP hydrolase)
MPNGDESGFLERLQKSFDTASETYCAANGLTRDKDWFILKLQEEVGELSQAWNKVSGRGRPRGKSADDLRRDLEDEAADVLGHVFLLAEAQGLDLRAAIKRKWLFAVED